MSSANKKKIDVQKVSFLARLYNKNMTPHDQEVYASQLNSIVSHVEELESVDTGNLQPTDGWRTNKIQDLRQDFPSPDQEQYQRVRDNIIAGFPNSQNNLLVIPGIFDNN